MGILGAALAGFGGGAKGYEAAMERRDAESAETQKHQWELDKEKRIEEAAIRAEGRSSTNSAKERQAALDFSTDPNNVKRAAQAKVVEQQAQDAYGDSRFPTKLDQEGQLFRAKTKPDSTLDIKEQQARIDHLNAQASGKASSGDNRIIAQALQSDVAAAQKALVGIEPTDPAYGDGVKAVKAAVDARDTFFNGLRQNDKGGASETKARPDPLGIMKNTDNIGVKPGDKAVVEPKAAYEETKPSPAEITPISRHRADATGDSYKSAVYTLDHGTSGNTPEARAIERIRTSTELSREQKLKYIQDAIEKHSFTGGILDKAKKLYTGAQEVSDAITTPLKNAINDYTQ